MDKVNFAYFLESVSVATIASVINFNFNLYRCFFYSELQVSKKTDLEILLFNFNKAVKSSAYFVTVSNVVLGSISNRLQS